MDEQKLVLYSNTFCFDARNEERIDLRKMIRDASASLEKVILHKNEEPDKEEAGSTILMVKGESTQGVECTLMKNGYFTILLPAFASQTDVALAFALLRAAKKQQPDLRIVDGDPDNLADLSDDNEEETYFYRLDNMANIIEKQDGHVGITGVNHLFHVLPDFIKSKMPDADPKDWTLKTYKKFMSVQWNYEDYAVASPLLIQPPEGEEFRARMLFNQNSFVGICQQVIICSNETESQKITPIDTFFEKTKDNPYIHRLDYAQFVMSKMPDDAWNKFMESMPGKLVTAPKTYLLRWNPTISSFKLEHYREACKCTDGFSMNWSVYEWQKAKKNDQFYMERLGDDGRGMVFRGVFASDPYPGEDWAGRGKQRYYVDIDCFEASPADGKPHITIEELKKALPDIDWDRGHSGQLLTLEQAHVLDDLWDKDSEKE